MTLHPEMDMWRYRITGSQYSELDKETDVWTPAFQFETEIFWEEDVAVQALERLKDVFPKASIRIQKTRDRWEDVR